MSVIAEWGWDGPATLDAGTLPARVTGAWGDYYRIVCDKGEGIARKKTSAFRDSGVLTPVTGDFVALKWNPSGESRIISVMPRRSSIERAAAGSGGRKAQTVAVNFDTLFILTSVNHDFSVRRIERFLSLASGSDAPAVVLLTKCDLVSRNKAEELRKAAESCAGSSPVFTISSLTGDGLEALAPYAKPRRTLAFLGSSGVGKSSLVNALAGETVMPTSEIREWDSRGRHTTTERELVLLPSGVIALDTPGLREIGMWDAETGIAEAFPDIEALASGCRFSDCRHLTEPGCAIKSALESGVLDRERWDAWRRLKAESSRKAPAPAKVESSHRYRR